VTAVSIWFADRRQDDAEEHVEAQVIGDDLILRAEGGEILLLDTRQVMKLILGEPD